MVPKAKTIQFRIGRFMAFNVFGHGIFDKATKVYTDNRAVETFRYWAAPLPDSSTGLE